MAELTVAVEETIAGRGRLFLVSGEPGIGKTCLADRLSELARARGLRVLWGRCWEGGGAPAYWPWVQALRAYVGSVDGAQLARELGRAAGHVAQLVPEVRDRVPTLPPAPGTSAVESPDARFALFDATAVFLRGSATTAPMLLVLDDLHAADVPSLLLLHFLARQLRDTPILVLGMHREAEMRRSPELSRVLGQLARESTGIALRGLSEGEVGEFVAASTGTPPTPAIVAALHRTTVGNPLFLDEIVRLLHVEGRLGDVANVTTHVAVPFRLREVIGRRLASLKPETIATLRIAAVIGQEFGALLLEDVAGCTPSALEERIVEATADELVGPVETAPGRHRFVHPLVRETLYDAIPEPERERLHARVGAAIEAHHAGNLEPHLSALAHHFFLATATEGEGVRAVGYAAQAARRAIALLAYEEAIAHLERALALLDAAGSSDDETRCDLLVVLGEAYRKAGSGERAAETLGHAAELARRLQAPVLLARVALAFGKPVTMGVVDEGRIGILEAALAALPASDDSLRARVLARLAWELYWKRGTEARRRMLCDEALGIARRLGDPATLAVVLSTRCFALWGPDALADRLASASEMLDLSIQAGDRELEAHAHHWRVIAFLELGDLPAVDREIAAQDRLVAELPQPEYAWWLAMWKAMRAWADGRLAEMETLVAEAFAIGEQVDRENATSAMQGQLFMLLREQGRLEHLVGSVETLRATQPSYSTYAVHCGLAMVHAELGRPVEAREHFEVFAATRFTVLPRDVGWIPGMYSLALACAFLGDAERAALLYEMLRPYRGLNTVAGPANICFGAVSGALGLLAATMQRWDDAEAHFDEALALCARMGAPTLTVRTQYDYAAMLATRDRDGDGARALRLTEDALGAARRLGMLLVAARAEELRARLAGNAAVAGEASPNLFCREGEYWSVSFDGATIRLRHTAGLGYLADLLAAPNQELAALVLTGASGDAGWGGDGPPMLDPQARAAYRARLADLRTEREEAERANDLGRTARLDEELAFLAAELGRAVGLHGRSRHTASPAERARQNVTKALRAALDRLAAAHPGLGEHLARTVRTGLACVYAPDPRAAVAWDVRR